MLVSKAAVLNAGCKLEIPRELKIKKQNKTESHVLCLRDCDLVVLAYGSGMGILESLWE